jgi:hypothetical protein
LVYYENGGRFFSPLRKGVYLRGRYEVQVEDSKGMEATNIHLGGLYGFIDPLEMVAKEPGVWQSYDITLVGRIVTVIANGKIVIQNQITNRLKKLGMRLQVGKFYLPHAYRIK